MSKNGQRSKKPRYLTLPDATKERLGAINQRIGTLERELQSLVEKRALVVSTAAEAANIDPEKYYLTNDGKFALKTKEIRQQEAAQKKAQEMAETVYSKEMKTAPKEAAVAEE